MSKDIFICRTSPEEKVPIPQPARRVVCRELKDNDVLSYLNNKMKAFLFVCVVGLVASLPTNFDARDKWTNCSFTILDQGELQKN